jgi:hypothetical protein
VASRASAVEFLQRWAEASADRLREQGYAGTDAELAALHAQTAGPEALARELRGRPGWAAAGVCSALAVGAAADLVAAALGGEAPAALLAALRRTCGGEEGSP